MRLPDEEIDDRGTRAVVDQGGGSRHAARYLMALGMPSSILASWTSKIRLLIHH